MVEELWTSLGLLGTWASTKVGDQQDDTSKSFLLDLMMYKDI